MSKYIIMKPTEPTQPAETPVEMLNGYPRVYGPFLGGSDSNIQNKIRSLYKKMNWDPEEADDNNEFFYLQNVNEEIIGAVKISNSDYELCYDFIQEEYRGKKLYSFLQQARLNYIKNTKSQSYVLDTEMDYLRDSHIKYGMICTSTEKVEIDGIYYWRLEFVINRSKRTTTIA